MIRKIIEIDENKCNGCGLCVNACHEGAIGLVNGKAKLLRDDYCDGLGNCLPVCPTEAITFVEREAAAFDEEAVKAAMSNTACGCPGSMAQTFEKEKPAAKVTNEYQASELRQWPVQIKLVPVNAPYFQGADLLVAADCAAYAYNNFHNDFIKDRITIIGCPKLDEGDYTEKLTAIIKSNAINSITVARMQVPCCQGIASAVVNAVKNSGKQIPLTIAIISPDGKIVE